MYAVQLSQLTKIYNANQTNQKLALDAVDLNIPAGSFFALLGPNGAGKSTIINILAGTVNKTSGKAMIMGVDIDEDIKKAKSLIGVVPQELIMDTFFPVAEALELYAGYYGIPKAQRQTEAIINALGLSDKRFNTAKQLSGGMKRRFLVAKAMVHSPKLLILDEPTAGVDINLREQLWEYVTKLNKNGTTVILTTHYLEEVEKFCDHIAFINHGKVIKNDSKENLLNSIGLRTLTIEFTTAVNILPPQIAIYEHRIISPNKIIITFEKTKVLLSKIIQDITSSGLIIKDLISSQATIEDVFKKIIN